MTYPRDPVPGPQVVVIAGSIYRRAFGETTWYFVSTADAERQAATYEATPKTHWAYAHERELASQYRAAIQSQHNLRKDAA